MRRNKVEERFDYKGYPCVVMFTRLGYRTGYVGVQMDSVFASRSSSVLNTLFSVHGGITYSSAYLFEQDDKGIWWIGFDCGHAWDGYDLQAAKEYFDEDISDIVNLYEKNEARTKEYVGMECCDLVNQIENLENIGFTELDICIEYMKNTCDELNEEIVYYLEKYKEITNNNNKMRIVSRYYEKPVADRLIDVLREVGGEK